MNDGFLFQAVIYLTAAIICVPIAKKLGLSSVLGYLLAGILIGPFVLGFIGEEGEDIMHFAEFGVVMMLFLIGLELEPSQFWKMRKMILGMGGLQVGGSILLFTILGMLVGVEFTTALTVSMALSLSSTAIVLQTLKEKNLMQTAAGQSSFSVLLFQDIAVIPMLALLPLLVVGDATVASGHGGDSFFDHLPAWQQTIAVLSSVVFIVVAGRVLIVPALRVVSKTHLRELFTASALLIVIAISYLMQTVGLSPALGAFLGGVVLANSEFRHELESDLEPFKGLLLGLFFIAVGASINFHLIADQPGLIALLVLVVMAVKTLIMLGIGKFFKLDIDQNLLFGLGLAQIGEFAFVLLSFASQLGLLDTQISGLIMAATAISMTISPILNIVNERVLLPRVGVKEKETKEMDAISESNGIILIGFSHFGSTVMRFLKIHGVKATILDNDSDRVALLRKMGFKVYYGDGTRVDLLESAGANTAKLLISAIDSPETNQRLVENVKKHFPNLELYVRAKNRYDAYELLDMGVNHIYRESLESSVRVGVDILTKLGFRAYSVNRSAQNFIKSDEASMLKLAKDRHNTEQYIVNVKNEIREQEMLLSEDAKNILASSDHAWDSELMRSTLNQISK